MSKPLSMSSYNLFMECPAKYENQKVKGLNPEFEMSYFIFGRALDEGFNCLLLKKDSYDIETDNILIELIKKKVNFIPNDYDGELIEDKEPLLKQCKKLGYPGDNIDQLVYNLFSKPSLSDKQRKCLAICCHASLKIKAHLMLKSFKKNILPKLSEVDSVQKEYNWKDDKGNAFIAKIDYRAKIGDARYLSDNKTSSNPMRDYPENAVPDSIQFAIYSPQTKDDKAFYAVFDKQIKKNREKECSKCKHDGTGRMHKTCDNLIDGKRCHGEWIESINPEAECLIRYGDIRKEEQAIAQKALTNVAEAIKTGIYPQNLKACKTNYGQKEVKCPFYDYCRTGDTKGLVKK